MKAPKLAGVFVLVGFLLTYLTFVKRQRDAAKLDAQHRPAAWTAPRRRGPAPVAPTPQYCIMFDAGSTGTRIHIFQFQMEDRGAVVAVGNGCRAVLIRPLSFLQEFRFCTRKRSDPSSLVCRPTPTVHGRWERPRRAIFVGCWTPHSPCRSVSVLLGFLSSWRWPGPPSLPPRGAPPLSSWGPPRGYGCCPSRKPGTFWTRSESRSNSGAIDSGARARAATGHVSRARSLVSLLPLVCLVNSGSGSRWRRCWRSPRFCPEATACQSWTAWMKVRAAWFLTGTCPQALSSCWSMGQMLSTGPHLVQLHG